MDRRVFRELFGVGYGLLPGRLPDSVGYPGGEVFMAVSIRSCRNERRKILYGANDSVCSGDKQLTTHSREGFQWGDIRRIQKEG